MRSVVRHRLVTPADFVARGCIILGGASPVLSVVTKARDDLEISSENKIKIMYLTGELENANVCACERCFTIINPMKVIQ